MYFADEAVEIEMYRFKLQTAIHNHSPFGASTMSPYRMNENGYIWEDAPKFQQPI